MSSITATKSSVNLQNRIAKALGKRVKRKTALLLDFSSSMTGPRYRNLCAAIVKFPQSRKFAFSDICWELIEGQPIPMPRGGTDMGMAFEFVKAQGIGHVVLVTDGEPNSEREALDKSAGLKIDIIYCGEPPAPPFLAKLANYCGGQYGEVDLGPEELETKIRGLLPAPGEEPIIL